MGGQKVWAQRGGLAAVVVGLGQKRISRNIAGRFPGLDFIRGDSPKPAALVVLFLAGVAADRSFSFVSAASGRRPHVSSFRATGAERPGAHRGA